MSAAVRGADARSFLLPPLLAQASRDAIALRHGAVEIDQAAFLSRAGAIAEALRSAGIGEGDVVALAASRTPDTIAAVVACIACGAAPLPLDPALPSSRLAAMAAIAGARVVVGDGIALPPSLPRVVVDADAHAALHGGAGPLAYVLFTSGSTGEPKGVAMRSDAFGELVGWHLAHPRLGRAAVTLQFAPLGFDVSFQELFSTLGAGGTLVLVDEAQRRDPYALLELIAREGVQRLFLPCVALQALAEAVAAGGAFPHALRDVVTAGEALHATPAVRALFAELPGAVLHNHYGPTESHVVSAHELAGDPATWPDLPPIGRALPHARLRVVAADADDATSAGADVGEGHLLIGGACLAAGYIGRPALTAERFVERDGARWYRSGDRVRIEPDGTLHYLGRLDDQLKIDGIRVEPGEIEAALCRHADVAQAVVVGVDGPAGRTLAAHIVPRDPHLGEAALASALRTHCAATLAPWLVPRTFAIHAALPLAASGKIDRRALARDADQALHWREGAPLAEQWLDLWRQLLDAPQLGADDNLFDHGARSLLVVRALTELRRHGHVLSVVQAYEYPSVAAQVALLEGGAVRDEGRREAERGVAQRAAFARFAPRAGGAR